ncbi:MAG TPA: SRPBCC family protein [Pseudonocardiaceae bacterium]|nr:SRPBCC family protein [Pseudonocardiaceae bacterium]
MRLEHEFSVPAPPDVVWAAVIDPERVAPCMPGASLTSVDGSQFSGGVKVKLGPVTLTYKGSGEFLETDEQARRVVIKASGKDARGNGTAAATVTVTLAPEGDGTKGTVVTDLTVTGKPAQFGRGMIVEVSGKILDSFAQCLATKLDAAPATAEPAAAKADAKPAEDEDEEPPPPAQPKPTRRRSPAKAATGGNSTTEPATDGATARQPEPEPAGSPRLQLVGEQESAPKAPARQVTVSAEAEPIDLMEYAGASVAKRAVPAVLAVLAVVFVVLRLRRRRRG